MTQCERIKAHLTTYGHITDNEARDRYGINRLAARISDLRHHHGMKITTENTAGKNRYGVKVHFATYRVEQ